MYNIQLVRFIWSQSAAALSHRNPESIGAFCGNCRSQRHDERGTLYNVGLQTIENYFHQRDKSETSIMKSSGLIQNFGYTL